MRLQRPLAALALLFLYATASLSAGTEYTYRTVVNGLRIPWELAWGPDGMLWATERQGVVSRINPETGQRKVVLDHSKWTADYGEGGMLGMCFHPEFPDSAYVYLAVNYSEDWKPSHRTLERWTYNAATSTLIDQVELLRFAPTAYGHQGGRLAFGTDGKIYMTLGENYHPLWEAQNDSTHLGKVIRVNPDGSIPDDNPIPGNPMWTKGHRNPQGILVMDDGRIFTAEHGNTIEDEINLLHKGGNYGWPAVEGPCDEPDELAFCDSAKVIEPFFSSGNQTTWAFSDIEYYNGDRFPKLKNSILLATLRHSSIYVLHLNTERTQVDSVSRIMPYAVGRIRDIAVSPDGRVFVSTSNYTDPNAGPPFPIEGDNHIYELMPLQAGTSALLVGPADTVRATSYEKERIFFTANVTNVGDAPTTITTIERVIVKGPIDDAHWNQPFVIMPGMTYPIIIQYYPWERGENIGHIRLISDNSNNVDIYIKGTSVVTGTHKLTLRPVATDLSVPWEIQWGPDSNLWTTERSGIVSRIHPDNGRKRVILDHRDTVLEQGEGGLLGLALHPSFPDSPYVYLAVNHGSGTEPEYRAIERWQYQAEADTLVNGTEIYRITPAAISNQGGRLQFGPDGMLYVTSGDNNGDGWEAQDPKSPLGNVLRLHPDGRIPDDNPFDGSPVWTLGHRDPQGLVILEDSTIFTSEQGAAMEDEVNAIIKGANYGWPGVEGACDDDAEQEFCDSVNPAPPIYSSGTEDTDGFSDLDHYHHERYPAFKNSLLMATLKRSTLLQLHLNDERTSVDSVTHWFPFGVGRIRDVEVSPDGRVFICTTNRDPDAKAPFPLDGDDRIYEIVPVDTGAYAILEGPDTLRVETYEDETLYFDADVTNVGNAPTLISAIDVIIPGPLADAHVQKPFVIMPGMTYPVNLRYYPWDSGKHEGQVRLRSNNSEDLDIHLFGNALPTSVRERSWTSDVATTPQPFTTSVQITVPESVSSGILRILDLNGRDVWSAPVEGTQTVRWSGNDHDGRPAPAGTYLLTISDGSTVLRSLIRRAQP